MSCPLLRSNTCHLPLVVYQYTQSDSLFNDFVEQPVQPILRSAGRTARLVTFGDLE